jgi:hypothetical protein
MRSHFSIRSSSLLAAGAEEEGKTVGVLSLAEVSAPRGRDVTKVTVSEVTQSNHEMVRRYLGEHLINCSAPGFCFACFLRTKRAARSSPI